MKKEKGNLKEKEVSKNKQNLSNKYDGNLVLAVSNYFFCRSIISVFISKLFFVFCAFLINLKFFNTYILGNKESTFYGFGLFMVLIILIFLHADYSQYKELQTNLEYFDSDFFRQGLKHESVSVSIENSPYKDEKDIAKKIELEKDYYNDIVVRNIERELTAKGFAMFIGFLPLILQIFFIYSVI